MLVAKITMNVLYVIEFKLTDYKSDSCSLKLSIHYVYSK